MGVRRGAEPGTLRNEAYQRIYATVDSIPRGSVASYGQVALEAGLPRRARLVGTALGRLSGKSELPWHRVVAASGHIRVRGSGARVQRSRLRSEGVQVDARGRIDLKCFGWQPEE